MESWFKGSQNSEKASLRPHDSTKSRSSLLLFFNLLKDLHPGSRYFLFNNLLLLLLLLILVGGWRLLLLGAISEWTVLAHFDGGPRSIFEVLRFGLLYVAVLLEVSDAFDEERRAAVFDGSRVRSLDEVIEQGALLHLALSRAVTSCVSK